MRKVGKLEQQVADLKQIVALQQEGLRMLAEAIAGHQKMFEALVQPSTATPNEPALPAVIH